MFERLHLCLSDAAARLSPSAGAGSDECIVAFSVTGISESVVVARLGRARGSKLVDSMHLRSEVRVCCCCCNEQSSHYPTDCEFVLAGVASRSRLKRRIFKSGLLPQFRIRRCDACARDLAVWRDPFSVGDRVRVASCAYSLGTCSVSDDDYLFLLSSF